MGKDHSTWAYRLIFDVIRGDLKCQIEFGMDPDFLTFVEAGINRKSIVVVLQIINIFLENSSVTLKVNLDYKRIA